MWGGVVMLEKNFVRHPSLMSAPLLKELEEPVKMKLK